MTAIEAKTVRRPVAIFEIHRLDPFSPALDTPLYQQLYTHMRAAILSGELKGGMKLPSTRALADELGVSRNTVLNAYGQLMAEGYLEGWGFLRVAGMAICKFFRATDRREIPG